VYGPQAVEAIATIVAIGQKMHVGKEDCKASQAGSCHLLFASYTLMLVEYQM
jgi:hypothetical protein